MNKIDKIKIDTLMSSFVREAIFAPGVNTYTQARDYAIQRLQAVGGPVATPAQWAAFDDVFRRAYNRESRDIIKRIGAELPTFIYNLNTIEPDVLKAEFNKTLQLQFPGEEVSDDQFGRAWRIVLDRMHASQSPWWRFWRR